MEHSSPLAAMQPPSLLPHFGLAPDNQLHVPNSSVFNPSFNFRDMNMKKPSSDYFAMKLVRGSSPTASLAADLSQNFHIDKSPQLPTPRRSLFTSNFFGALSGREQTTTPPLPSSSPGPGNDSMDMSPLPHKAPFSTFRVEIESPTPEVSPMDMSMDMSSPLPSSPLDGLRANSMLERKKPTIRPSFARTKGSYVNSMSMKTNTLESQLPSFRFGTAGSNLCSSSLSLGECFTESPPQDRKTGLNNPSLTLMGPPRMKQPFPSLASSARNGSPVYGHVRKSSTQAARPRKLFRRSLSMFEHPGDIMKEKKDACPASGLQSIVDVDEDYKLLLPNFIPEDRPDCLPRVTKETLVDVLDGKYNQLYAHTIVVDCRFEYEYEGGHIEGAVNYNDKELLAKELFEGTPSNTLLILHCEYSAHRAPIMAQFLRHRDRAANDYRYPKLTYPEVYILDGGYSSFFAEHRSRCYPQNYVEMGAKEHANTCEREMGRFRHRSKLNRAQTFAFGQQMDDSPTAVGKGYHDTMMMGMAPSDNAFDSKRVHTRRMASY